ncbi:hypothetical protein V2J09_006284 [Rumex salicifolius]
MAKAKKQAKDDGAGAAKGDNSEAVVLHQKLCLSIDMENCRIYGYTELRVAVPDSGIVGLHAENLEIERVCVDGEPAEFDVFPHFLPVEIEDRWCSVSSVGSAADAAGATYLSALERELVPNLLIFCQSKPSEPEREELSQLNKTNGGSQSTNDFKQNERLVRIDYWVDKTHTGTHFDGAILHTSNQIRRAHCWFPCMDDSSHICCYHLEFTVPQNFVAVSNGNLLYQVLSKDDPPRKTFVYELKVPVYAKWITLVVAPLQILADCRYSQISHMCLPDNIAKLQNTVGFFHCAFRHFESYLKASFPFGSYKQVFLPPEMTFSGLTMGASMVVFSSQLLFDEKVIDQNIDTKIRIAYAIARQWFGVYITPDTLNDEWLIEGLAGFLTDTFIKEFFGSNEAQYRRYKIVDKLHKFQAYRAVCKVDDCGLMALSTSASTKDLFGTQSIGFFGKIRSWKSVAILQMLEKQMGPDLFKGILQTIVSRAQSATESSRTLNTKEFRQFANKLGNLERPFLKEFFHRWVKVCGCPVLRMGFSYHKRKNTVELAAFRECTATPGQTVPLANGNIDSENRDGDGGWPGMITVKVHELDGTHDHLLPMSGDTWQLLDIRCHSKLASKRYQKTKKGLKPDGSDDCGDTVAAPEMRSSTESPLLWLRADPQMEYLAEIHFYQPVQMWINQLEKDKDVVAQAQAIIALEALPQFEFCIVNVLNNFFSDSKENDWCGLVLLVKFYRSKRYDEATGLPKPNNFNDFSEYFVLQAIPLAVATVRGSDGRSPREAVEFVLQVLKYNDNNGNPYSDVFWLAALVEAVGELEFGQETIPYLSSLLKRIDRLLQFERLMPSYNGILTISCIRSLTQIALKLSDFVPLESISENIKLFQDHEVIWQVRMEASRALLDLEMRKKGTTATLALFIKQLEDEPSVRGQVKLAVHMCRLCQIRADYGHNDEINSQTLVALLRLLESYAAFCNVFLRHHLFCTLQVLAGRRPTLYGFPRDQTRQMSFAQICSEQRNNFTALFNQVKPLENSMENHNHLFVGPGPTEAEEPKEAQNICNVLEPSIPVAITTETKHDGLISAKEADTVSNSQEMKMQIKIKLKKPTSSSKTGEADNITVEKSYGVYERDIGPSSSVSLDALQGNLLEPVTVSNDQNIEEVNSCQGHESHVTASIGSAKYAQEGEELGKELELQCTADSSSAPAPPMHENPPSPHIDIVDDNLEAQMRADAHNLSVEPGGGNGSADKKSKKKKNKDNEKRRKREDDKSNRDDPEYLEKKRIKREKKQREKEMEKLTKEKEIPRRTMLVEQGERPTRRVEPCLEVSGAAGVASDRPNVALVVPKTTDTKPRVSQGSSGVLTHKLRIKIKSRALARKPIKDV